MPPDSVIIIGGGLQGCAIGLFLARAGWNVTIVEKNTAGRHASGVNAGGLRLLLRDWREYPLAERALTHWSNLAVLVGEDLASSCEVQLGTSQIAIAMDEAEWSYAQGRARDIARRGLGEEMLLSRSETRDLLPGISRSALGGLISRRDGHANPAASARAFQEAAKRAGVRLVQNCRVVGLERAAGEGWKVDTSSGSFSANRVINCGGAWGSRIAALVGEDLPERIMAPSMMVTTRVKPFIEPVVIGIDRPLSFKQSAVGTLVIGGGILGEARPDQDTSFTVMDRMATAAAAAIEAFPALANISIVRTWTGLEGGTPDGIPIIGPSSKHPGVWHVFGFCGHGFLLAPAVGELVASSLVQGKLDERLRHFSPRRFAKTVAPSAVGAAE